MGGWLLFGAIVAAAAAGVVILFRSLRRWQQSLPKTPEQVQAEMQLFAESRQTDRY